MEILFIALTTAGIAVLAFFVLAVLVNLGRSLRSTPQSAESTLRQEQTEISPPLNSSPQSAESTLRQEQTEISPPLNSSPQSAESTLRKEEPEISPHQHIWLAKEPIRIGILHSTSGPMASAEQGSVDAALLAVEEINVRGGILGRSVEAIVRDGASDPQKFAQGAASLIEVDQVASIFGCWLTPTRQAVKKIVEDADHLLWYPLLYEGYEASKNIIYTGSVPNQQVFTALDWWLENQTPPAKEFYLVGSNYNFSIITNWLVRQYLESSGLTCLGEWYRPIGNLAFAEVVEQLEAAPGRFVVTTINSDDSVIGFYRGLYEKGITSKDLPTISFSMAEGGIRRVGYGNRTAGHYAAWCYFQSIQTARNVDFVQKFQKRYGDYRTVSDPDEAAYHQIYLFARAAEKARDLDPLAIRDEVLDDEFYAPGGLVKVDRDTQHCYRTPRVGEIRVDGHIEIAWTSPNWVKPDPYPEKFPLPESLEKIKDSIILAIPEYEYVSA